jgi:hypothetical protein
MLLVRRFKAILLSTGVLLICLTIGFASPVTVIDKGGQVYNVKAYGAVGNGVADDTAALDAAITACNESGGTLFLPSGKFLITRTLVSITKWTCGIIGAGVQASQIIAKSMVGDIILINNIRFNQLQHNQVFRDFSINCTGADTGFGGPRENTGIHTIDSLMQKFDNVAVENCTNAFFLEDAQFFTERDSFDHVTVENFTNGWYMQKDASDKFDGFAHSTWNDIFFNTYNIGDSLFSLNGLNGTQADMYSDYVEVNGNFGGSPSYLFTLQGSAGFSNSLLFVFAENDTSQIYIARALSGGKVRNSCVVTNPCFNAIGYINWMAPAISLFTGSPWGLKKFSSFGASRIGGLTTTASPRDSITNPSGFLITPTKATCFVTPTNSIAASLMNRTYISAATQESVTVTHPSTAGATFSLWCQ